MTEAPQAVDNEFWAAATRADAAPQPRFLFVGRLEDAKGVAVLAAAWRSVTAASDATLTVVGSGPQRELLDGLPRVSLTGALDAPALRDIYASCDVLIVPSIATRTFLEPWGLVVNEAMNQSLAVIASDAVGAAAGGLVRDERNGLVVPAGDAGALAAAITRLARERNVRERFAAAGRLDVAPFTHQAWVDGIWGAITAAGR